MEDNAAAARTPGCSGPGARGGAVVRGPHQSGSLIMSSQHRAAFLLSVQISVILAPDSTLTAIGPDKAAKGEGLGVFSKNSAVTIRNWNIVTSAHCNINNFFREVKCRQTIVFLFLSKV